MSDRVIAAVVWALCLTLFPGVSAAGGETPMVSAIRVKGNLRTDEEQILRTVGTRVGEPLDRARLSDDVKALYRLGNFRNIIVDADEGEGGVALTFIVEERPSIYGVKIEGNESLDDAKIEEKIDIRPNSIFKEKKAKETARKIRDLYVEEGYYTAEVDYEARPREGDPSRVTLLFVVTENAKVEIKKITIVGNEAYDDGELKGLMQTKEGLALGFVTEAGTYQKGKFDLDRALIEQHYLTNGYLGFRMEEPHIFLSPDRRYLYLTLRLEEGPRYRIGKIDFDGDLLGEREEFEARVREKLLLKPGQWFNRMNAGLDVQNIAGLYADEGYAYANVMPQPVPRQDADEPTVDITYRIEKGEPVYIRRISFSGNTKTRDRVLRREMRIGEGALFNKSAIDVSETNLRRLGYFDEVKPLKERVPGVGDVDLRFQVKEGSQGTFNFGASFSSIDRFAGMVSVSQSNLFGMGLKLRIDANVGRRVQRYNLYFEEPRLLDSNFGLSVRIFNTSLRDIPYDRKSQGGQLSLKYHLRDLFLRPAGSYSPNPLAGFFGRMLAGALGGSIGRDALEYTYVSLGLLYERLEISNIRGAGSAILSRTRPESVTNSIILGAGRDTRDHPLQPRGGSLTSGSVEIAANYFRMDANDLVNNFVRYSFKNLYYHSFSPWEGSSFKTTFGLFAKVKFLQSLEDKDLLITERFRIGGIDSLRGFENRTVGPVSLNDDGSRTQIGGNKELVVQAEWQVPLVPEAGLELVAFFDLGNVYSDGEWPIDSTGRHRKLNLLYDAGFGVRWFSPIGPLRLEWGFPLFLPEEERERKSPVFQFSIGQIF